MEEWKEGHTKFYDECIQPRLSEIENDSKLCISTISELNTNNYLININIIVLKGGCEIITALENGVIDLP